MISTPGIPDVVLYMEYQDSGGIRDK